MTINTAQVELKGHTYEVVADSTKINEPMFSYCQIYRLRQDGSRGRLLASQHELNWAVWMLVRDQIKAAEAA